MRLSIPSAAVLGILTSGLLAPAQTQGEAGTGVRIRIVVLKVSTFEKRASNGVVVVGPQTGIELEWRLLNGTSDTIEIPSPDALRLRVEGRGGEIPVRMEWAPNMALRMRATGELTVTTAATGPVSLTGGSSLWLRGSAERTDGLLFTPGEYVLIPDVGGLPPRRGDAGTLPRVDSGFPVGLRVVELAARLLRLEGRTPEGRIPAELERLRALAPR